MQNPKLLGSQINSCLYLAKGVTDYLGVWKMNEFVVPLPPSNSILAMIRAASVSKSSRNKELKLLKEYSEKIDKLSA